MFQSFSSLAFAVRPQFQVDLTDWRGLAVQLDGPVGRALVYPEIEIRFGCALELCRPMVAAHAGVAAPSDIDQWLINRAGEMAEWLKAAVC